MVVVVVAMVEMQTGLSDVNEICLLEDLCRLVSRWKSYNKTSTYVTVRISKCEVVEFNSCTRLSSRVKHTITMALARMSLIVSKGKFPVFPTTQTPCTGTERTQSAVADVKPSFVWHGADETVQPIVSAAILHELWRL